jgi:hypothetical protein
MPALGIEQLLSKPTLSPPTETFYDLQKPGCEGILYFYEVVFSIETFSSNQSAL